MARYGVISWLVLMALTVSAGPATTANHLRLERQWQRATLVAEGRLSPPQRLSSEAEGDLWQAEFKIEKVWKTPEVVSVGETFSLSFLVDREHLNNHWVMPPADGRYLMFATVVKHQPLLLEPPYEALASVDKWILDDLKQIVQGKPAQARTAP